MSYFRTEQGKSEPGLCFGIGKEFYPIRSFNGFLGLGLDYKRKKYTLANRSWPSEFDPYDSDVITGDINVDISYLEMPLKFGYSIKINENYSSIIYAGYCLSISINESTKIANRKSIPLRPEERGTYEFDYIREDWDHATGSTNFHLGTRLSYKRFAILFNYSRAISVTEGILSLSIRDKIDTFEISTAFLF